MNESYSFVPRDIFNGVVHEVDEANQLIKVFGINKDSSLSLIGKFALGTGACLYEDKLLAEDTIYNDVVDSIIDRASEYPITLPAELVTKMRKLADLSDEADALGKEIKEEMQARFEDSFDFESNPFTAGDFDSRNFLQATPRPGIRNPDEMVLDAHEHIASQNHPGCYVWQSRYGVCEDSWYGEMFFCTKRSADGTAEEFVRLPFEI